MKANWHLFTVDRVCGVRWAGWPRAPQPVVRQFSVAVRATARPAAVFVGNDAACSVPEVLVCFLQGDWVGPDHEELVVELHQ